MYNVHLLQPRLPSSHVGLYGQKCLGGAIVKIARKHNCRVEDD